MANSRKRCVCCKEYFQADTMVRHPSGWFKDNEHAMVYANRKRAKAEKKARTEKVRNFRMKDPAHQRALTQKAVNKLAKLLDKGMPCISCGRPDAGKKRDASHYKSVGANSAIRYDLRNIHSACVWCNQHLSGAIAGFQKGLHERYGQVILDYLESAPRLKAWTLEELESIRKEAAAECRRLESGEKPSRDWRSIAPSPLIG